MQRTIEIADFELSRGAVTIDARLLGAPYMPYANLIETMLAGTAAFPALAGSSLQTAFAKARQQAGQIAAGHPVWDAAARLFPEVFDGTLRAELIDLGQLPAWAIAASAADSQAALAA